jgi:DNA topoisomerase I
VDAYCVKCKEKRPMQDAEATFTSTGTPASKGVCPVCSTKLFRMGKTDAHEGMIHPEVVKKSRKSKKAPKRKGKLVIVESPAKARTVGRFLGKGYKVRASVGHVRDLLRSQISVDVENEFTPKYRVPNEKRQVVKDLKADAAGAEEIYLATDPDREGEAIAWHLLEAAEIDPELSKRVVFHEITKSAIDDAFGHPRQIDMHLVDAQQARRILDRLVGYNLSPLLWTKVRSRLSAGRVQSVALRIIVDREREIRDFVPQEYWSIDADFIHPEKPPQFRTRLTQIDGETFKIDNEEQSQQVMDGLRRAEFVVGKVRRGSRVRKPYAPFTTSTLQQDASRRLGFTARRTMAIAQQLYEGIEMGSGDPVGLITYMRTDSTQVSKQAQSEARAYIKEQYGPEYVPEKPPFYKTKARKAQEAHEAVRPTSVKRTPEKLKSLLSGPQYKLYRLIWQRFVASQMKPAEYDTLSIAVRGISPDHTYELRVSASSLRFSGFLKVYGDTKESKSSENGAEKLQAKLAQLPDLVSDDPLSLLELIPEQHFTQPPARFSDASLIRTLEEHGIGRPSTYAPTLTTLLTRGYVERTNRRLFTTEIGEVVNDLIVEHFPEIVDLGFTARMEGDLDEIAQGEQNWVEIVKTFYGPFAKQVEIARELMPEVKAEPELLDRFCPECENQLLIRYGRFGKFIGCSNFPTCRYTEPWLEKIGVSCPKCTADLVERRTRKGRTFYGCSRYPECDFTSWKRPLPQPCPNCKGLLVVENRNQASCIACENKFELSALQPEEEKLA